METTTPSKKYRLRSEPSHFYAGYLKDGTQVLMRVDYPKLVAVLFDTEGTYLKTLVRVISQEAQTAIRAKIVEQDVCSKSPPFGEFRAAKDEIGSISFCITKLGAEPIFTWP